MNTGKTLIESTMNLVRGRVEAFPRVLLTNKFGNPDFNKNVIDVWVLEFKAAFLLVSEAFLKEEGLGKQRFAESIGQAMNAATPEYRTASFDLSDKK